MMLPVENTSNIGNDIDFGWRNTVEAVMVSTASDVKAKKAPAKSKKTTGKKKVVRKTASRKSKTGSAAVKTKTLAKKKAASTKKVTGSRSRAGKKTAAGKAPAKRTRKTANTAATATMKSPAEATRQSVATGPGEASPDSKSLSWMAAQAASALKAVRANQTERAQALIAKAEITPAPPARPRKMSVLQKQADAPEKNQDTSTTTASSTREPVVQSGTAAPQTLIHQDTLPATPPEIPAVAAEANTETNSRTSGSVIESVTETAQNKQNPVARQTSAAPGHCRDTQVDNSAQTQPKQPAAQVASVIASKSTRKGYFARRLLLPGAILLVGILVVQSWLSDDETPKVATTSTSSEIENPAPVAGNKPAAEAIATLPGKPPAKPAAAGAQTDDWSPTVRPGWPIASDNPQTPEALTNHRATTRQSQPVPKRSAVITRGNQPATPPAGYYAPGYGYYPQQPVTTQPHFQPGYSRPPYLQ